MKVHRINLNVALPPSQTQDPSADSASHISRSNIHPSIYIDISISVQMYIYIKINGNMEKINLKAHDQVELEGPRHIPI